MPLRPMSRDQAWLLPPTLDELLPDDHPARFVAAFVDGLDHSTWADMGIGLEGDAMGAPAYHPRALLSIWLYGFMTGIRSCRKLEAACRDQISFLWLTGWQQAGEPYRRRCPVDEGPAGDQSTLGAYHTLHDYAVNHAVKARIILDLH